MEDQTVVFRQCVFLIRELNRRCAALIVQFVGSRCSLCDRGTAVGVKDSSRTWQFWCLECALVILLDQTHINIHAQPASLAANHSAESECWSEPDLFLDGDSDF